MYNFIHKTFDKLLTTYVGFKTTFKTFCFLVIIFLMFFAVILFFAVKNKQESAYTVLEKVNKGHKPQDMQAENFMK